MDSLTGGIGSDTFVLAQHLTNMVAAIQDFTAGTDNIGLGQAAFGDLFNNGSLMDGVFAVSTSATTAAMRLYYNQTQGTLYYDSDGNGGSVAIAIANFSSKPVVSASNFMLAVGV